MGLGRRKLAPLWALALALACARHTGLAQQSSADLGFSPDLRPMQQSPADASGHSATTLPPLRTVPVVQAPNPAHNGRVCSTWGDFHYKTFDGAVFRFPGLCNYVLCAHCGGAYEDFNVQLRRCPKANATTLCGVTMKLDGVVLQLSRQAVLVDGNSVQLPFSQLGVTIEQSGSYLKVTARLGLVFMWNQDDSLLLELDPKYANQTCGLCGDFNGDPDLSEFHPHGVGVSALEFGNLQKMDGPTEQCQDPVPENPRNCSTESGICEELLLGRLFSGCSGLVEPSGYLDACRHDLCACEHSDVTSCVCNTLAEFSRQCAHAGGRPLDWRSPDLCPATCHLGMQHRECGSPCADTCSNPERSQLCDDHCMAGCFCPEGTVFDDIGQTGCIPVGQCYCVHNGATYAPGASYNTDCAQCTCSAGRWTCQEVPCPGTCAVLGGAHVSTFDDRQYTVHGDCSYVLSKPLQGSAFSVLAELRRCGLSDNESCLKSVTLSVGPGQTVVEIKASGEVFVNHVYTQLPVSAANVTLFRPSTFFIIAHTELGLQLAVQLVPIMQVFVRLEPQLRGQTCGLCGNFNQNQADDFRALSGVVEGTAAAFANTWKTQAACPNVRNSFEDPCSLSVENEKYAQHWCSRLTDAQGPFAPCHAVLSPTVYYSNCMFDTCNCEKSEDCMCAALSAYVHACAAKGVLLTGWRDGVCVKPMSSCPKSLTYQYHVRTCQPTCRARGGEDVTCAVSFVPVDGCACPPDTFLDDQGKCVPASSCPCYHGGSVVPSGESLHENGALCTCSQGKLSCIGKPSRPPVCAPPMVYVDCRNATPGTPGAACQKSCHTLDMACYNPQCVSGCVCPDGLVADGNGGCVAEEECPCVHNEASYQPGQSIRVGCNTCTCANRKWQCTDEPCLATCAVYGDGHYLTFDGQRYSFSGDCEYTLLQDHCGGGNGSSQDALRVVTENVPCGSTGTTCSKAIKLFLGSFELRLSDGKAEVIEKAPGRAAPFSIRQMGIYLVVDTQAGLVLLWDRRTSLFLRLEPEFKGRVCGLCGNFDDKAINDFTTRGQSVVGSALEFGNSWKFSPSCPDAPVPREPCAANPYRRSWAQKQCSLINSATFAACHAHVEPSKYYEACVSDACACDSGGDCECFCTAVAAYAQACHDVGVCVSWRTPDICPLFCDYYNPEGQCEWHYQPCGLPCMRTCRNPSGHCLHNLPGLEGCYPKCPPEAPIFDEDRMQCVAKCPPPPPTPCSVAGQVYLPGARVPAQQTCQSCMCTENGVRCVYDSEACICTYGGLRFRPGDPIYNTTDGTGGCIYASCGANGTIDRRILECAPATPAPPTTFTFSTIRMKPTPTPTPRTTTQHPSPSMARSEPPTTPGCGEDCQWSAWLDVSRPGQGKDSGDFDTLDNLRAHGHQVCRTPREVQCRAEDAPEVPLEALGQKVQCSLATGLTCFNREQTSGRCRNYQVRVLCCAPRACPPASSTTRPTPTPPGSPPSTVPCLRERCSWTAWFDGSYPKADRNGGDFDTFSNLRAKGYHFCQAPSRVECRAERFPNTPLAELGQTLVCDTQVGLLCLNRDQLPPICYNYQIRMQCCELVDECGTGTSPTASVRPDSTTHRAVTSGTSACQPRCSWTRWVDVDFPTPGPHGGDFETYSHIISRGEKVCGLQDYVGGLECRAENHPEVSIEQLGQVVSCHPDVGLVCRNEDQKGPFKMCLNYEIRVLCCEPQNCSGTPTHIVPVTSTAATHATSTTSVPATSTTSIPTTSTTSTPATSTTSTPATSTTSIPTTSTTSTPATSTTSTPATSTTSSPTTSTTSSPTTSTTSSPTTSTTSIHATNTPTPSTSTTSTPVTSTTSTPATSTTSTPITTTPAPTSQTSHPITGTSACQPRCSWTRWVDVDFPTPGPNGGDFETYSHIISRGEKVCGLQDYVGGLECRAENHPEVSIEQLGQVVSCHPDVGLVCRNEDQKGPFKMCLNYEIRVLCCEPQNCSGTPTHIVPVTSTAATHATSTTSTPATSTTSTPATSTTSTPATSTTSIPTTSTTSIPTTSTTSTPATSTTSTPATSTTSSPTTSTTSTPATSTTSSPTTSTTSSPITSTTSTPTTSTTSTPVTSTSSTPATSTTSIPTTSTTSIHATNTPTPSTSTISTPTTRTTSTPTSSTTSTPITTTPAPTSQTSHPITGTSACQPRCSWTRWVDVDFPTPGPHGGDFETYSHIISRGEKVCGLQDYVGGLECRAENHPEVSIEQLGQVVSCHPDVGLVCRNEDQKGPFKMCLNYEIRVLCCEPQNCSGTPTHIVPVTSTAATHATSTTSTPGTSTTSTPATSTTSTHATSTTSTPATSTTSIPTTSTTSTPATSTTSTPATSTTSTPATSTTSTPATSTTSIPATSRTSIPTTSTTSSPTTSTTSTSATSTTSTPVTSTTSTPTSSTTSTPITTTPAPTSQTSHPITGTSACQPRCSWTRWVDVDFPTPGPNGGDFETYSHIISRGEKVCGLQDYVGGLECRAENHPEVSIEQLGQVVSCHPDVGLVCRNEDQKGPFKMCLNYEIRVLCCEPQNCSGTPTHIVPVTSTAATHATSTTSTPGTSTTSTPATSTTSTPGTSTTSTPATSTTSIPTTSTTSTPATSTTSTPATSTTSSPTTSTTSTPGTSTTSTPATSTTSTPATSTTSTPATSTTSTSTTSTTSTPITTTPAPTSQTSHPITGTSACQPRCSWTRWVDVDFPTPGPNGGDFETYSHIISRGEKVCGLQDYVGGLECRAENHPEVSIEQLGQVVSCHPDVGLVCRNEDQKGPFKMCLNYEIRVLCCEPQNCSGTPTHIVPVTSTAATHATSTTSTPGTSTTSTPATSTTSTPGTSTTSTPATSTTSTPATSTTSSPTTSTTSTPGTSTTSTPATSTTSTPATSTTSTPATSTTSTSTTSTTSTPITTTPAPTSQTSHPITGTSACQPRCSWTRWVDVDFPTPGPNGGDFETYSHIISRGEKVCGLQDYVGGLECRAENHPEVSIEQLGQVVSCHPDVGLVCRNEDQKGPFKMCLNYEIRVLCCEPQNCSGTPVTQVMTSTPKPSSGPPVTQVMTSTPKPSSGPPVTQVMTSTPKPSSGPPVTQVVTSIPKPSSGTTCFCSVSDKLYPAGSVIYQEEDLAGHCYYALCSLDCHVVRGSDQTCHTSTPPAPSTSLPVSTSTVPNSVSEMGCPNAVPPRRRGESWPMANCSQAICEGNHVISLHPRPCPPPVLPTCANGYPAVMVEDQDSCCPQFECQCVCSGWGDPHYITFDGTYYTFLDNCTYVLVQQVVPVFGHFRVLIDNYFCDAEDGLSCPQAIIVEYGQARVALTYRPELGLMTRQILFNGEVVSPGFQKDGLDVSQVGVKMFVRIPALGVRVMFSGLIFSVEVPFSKFTNNTEGQCGTCTNDQKDECRLPGGTTVSSCSDMSRYWKVTIPEQPSCQGLPPTPWIQPTPPSPPCPPSPICELILSEVFSACHTVIPPRPYYEGCMFDQCRVGSTSVVCSSLELYSSLCASHDMCIDWRGLTNHTCPFPCPDDKEYRACGPSSPTYCYGNASLPVRPEGSFSEGCFCPEGSTLFSPSVEICVSSECTGCLGRRGEPVEPGQTVVADCQECTCDAASRTLTCRPQTCPPPPACPAPGLVPVPTAPRAGHCCPTYSCDCNASYCPELMGCPQGFRLELSQQEGACCPTQTCVLIPGCSVNGTLYQPGAVVSWSPCETCRCEARKGTPTDTFVLSCETKICDSNCSLGFEYQSRPGQCCGACVQVACVVNASGSTQLRSPGESWSEPGNGCVNHTCERHQDGFIVVTTKKACPQLSCPKDQAWLSEDGCCLTCPSPPPQHQNKSICDIHQQSQVIRQRNCSSAEPVSLTYCHGNCGNTTSMYSLEAGALQHECRCCQELRVSWRNVTLHCTDGSRQTFSYAHVEECGCVGLHCHGPGDQSQEPPEEEPWTQGPGQEAGRWQTGARGVAPHH